MFVCLFFLIVAVFVVPTLAIGRVRWCVRGLCLGGWRSAPSWAGLEEDTPSPASFPLDTLSRSGLGGGVVPSLPPTH